MRATDIAAWLVDAAEQCGITVERFASAPPPRDGGMHSRPGGGDGETHSRLGGAAAAGAAAGRRGGSPASQSSVQQLEADIARVVERSMEIRRVRARARVWGGGGARTRCRMAPSMPRASCAYVLFGACQFPFAQCAAATGD